MFVPKEAFFDDAFAPAILELNEAKIYIIKARERFAGITAEIAREKVIEKLSEIDACIAELNVALAEFR
jgi:hypothetical protein